MIVKQSFARNGVIGEGRLIDDLLGINEDNVGRVPRDASCRTNSFKRESLRNWSASQSRDRDKLFSSQIKVLQGVIASGQAKV